MKRAVVVGAGGQDGYYLTSLLKNNGYQIICLKSDGEINICDKHDVKYLIADVQPNELYHLAAFHQASENHRSLSNIEEFEKSWKIHVLSTLYILDAMRESSPDTRMFFAGSSQMYGFPSSSMQNEDTPFNPNNVYGITKHAGLNLCQFYRINHDLFVAGGILFNHESPRRKPNFVSRKIIQKAVSISQGSSEKLILGDLNAVVDWGFAGDFVDAMYSILQTERAEDFIVATGEKHSVRDFVREAFRQLDLDWEKHIEIDSSILKKTGFGNLVGDASKLRYKTGWAPKVSFNELIEIMIKSELGYD